MCVCVCVCNALEYFDLQCWLLFPFHIFIKMTIFNPKYKSLDLGLPSSWWNENHKVKITLKCIHLIWGWEKKKKVKNTLFKWEWNSKTLMSHFYLYCHFTSLESLWKWGNTVAWLEWGLRSWTAGFKSSLYYLLPLWTWTSLWFLCALLSFSADRHHHSIKHIGLL